MQLPLLLSQPPLQLLYLLAPLTRLADGYRDVLHRLVGLSLLLAELLLLHVGLLAERVHGRLRLRQLAEAALEKALLLHQLGALLVEDALVHLHLRAVVPGRGAAGDHGLVDGHQVGDQLLAVVVIALAQDVLEGRCWEGFEPSSAPVLGPQDGAAREEGGVSFTALAVQRVGGVHGQHDAQVSAHARCEKLKRRRVLEALAGERVAQRGQDSLQLLIGEQPWDLAAAQQRIHVLQEGAVRDVVVLQEQQHWCVFAARLNHHVLEVVAESLQIVVTRECGGEDVHVVDVSHERGGTAAAHAGAAAQ
mmetsp:Transcript_12082/g.30531  ORF Transcript_12082/g.30531 Transcript_12082/m.30531 type:complete len:306 (-) Transcript_12082:6737-7654(-)